MTMCMTWQALYRAYRRQVRTLPHAHLRRFFAIKGADDFRSLLGTQSSQLRRTKLKRISKDLHRLRAANHGQSVAFDRVLDMAYGRIGRLRWELMEPLLSRTSTTSSSPMHPWKERPHLPACSPELIALLTSSISHATRPLQKHQLISPPELLGRAKSDPVDGMSLASPSSRRQHNTRWRFLTAEWKKVYPPLQTSLQCPADHASRDTSSFQFGFQNVATLQELLALAGSPSTSPEPPRRQRRQRVIDANPFDGPLPLRWLRRRYQALLGRTPLLVPRPLDGVERTYDIQLADNAITTSKPHPSRLRFVDPEDVSWISDITS